MVYQESTTKVVKENIMSWSGDLYLSIWSIFIFSWFATFQHYLYCFLEGYGYVGA